MSPYQLDGSFAEKGPKRASDAPGHTTVLGDTLDPPARYIMDRVHDSQSPLDSDPGYTAVPSQEIVSNVSYMVIEGRARLWPIEKRLCFLLGLIVT